MISKIRGNIGQYICSNMPPPIMEILFSFIMGIVFGPLGYGLIFVVLWSLLYEPILYLLIHPHNCWSLSYRFLIFVFSILGWLLGRKMTGMKCMHLGNLEDFGIRKKCIPKDKNPKNEYESLPDLKQE